MNINPNLLLMLAVATTISTFLNLFLLGFIKGICSDFLEELKEIKEGIEEQNNKPPKPAHHIVGMFINSLFSEIFNKKTQPDGQSISGVYGLDNIGTVPTPVLREALKIAEKDEMFEDAAKIKAELTKRGVVN